MFKNFSIDIRENAISCILGPSGCGKTTLLNILCKSENIESGELIGFDDKKFSYIFQEPRLMPWKTVKQNITFISKDIYSKSESSKIADNYIKLVNLSEFSNFYPHQLSGGMKQRTTIARAFSYPSDIILMDEAFSGLDIKLKHNLIKAFRKLWNKDKRTVIFVTHDFDEALLLGNDIYLFSENPVKILKKFEISIPENKREINDPYIDKFKNEIVEWIN